MMRVFCLVAMAMLMAGCSQVQRKWKIGVSHPRHRQGIRQRHTRHTVRPPHRQREIHSLSQPDAFPVVTSSPTYGKVRQLRIFVDRSSIEAFDADGKMVMTNLVFPLFMGFASDAVGQVRAVAVMAVGVIFLHQIFLVFLQKIRHCIYECRDHPRLLSVASSHIGVFSV